MAPPGYLYAASGRHPLWLRTKTNSAQQNENTMISSQVSGPSDRRKRSRVLDAEVGQAIRLHRKNAKMTLQGLADRLGIAYQQVQKYETGVNRVGAGRLMEIAEILNVPVASFFEGARVKADEGGNPQDTEAVVQGRQLLMTFMRITDPEKRHSALAYVQSLLEQEN